MSGNTSLHADDVSQYNDYMYTKTGDPQYSPLGRIMKTRKRLPFFIWIAPWRTARDGSKRRRTVDAALDAVRQAGCFGERESEVVYNVLRALQTGESDFLNEAIRLFTTNFSSPVRKRSCRTIHK